MGKISFILLEAGLELIPDKMKGFPSVRSTSKRRRKPPRSILLDKSLHYKDMLKAKLDNVEKRGRPDIVHIVLLNLTGSILNKKGLIGDIYVHTVNNQIIRVDPSTRIPRNYNRFTGLMEQLLEKGRVPPDSPKPLIEVVPRSLGEIVDSYDRFIVFEKGCKKITGKDVEEMKHWLRGNILLGVGGFPQGWIRKDIMEQADECYAIYDYGLDSWTVFNTIVCIIESRALNLL